MHWNSKVIIITTSIIHVVMLQNNGFVEHNAGDKFFQFKVGEEENLGERKDEVQERQNDLDKNKLLSNIEVILEEFRQSLSTFIKDWAKIAKVENPELLSKAPEKFLTEIKRFCDEGIVALERLNFEDFSLKYSKFRSNINKILDDLKKTFMKLLLIPQKDIEDFSRRAGILVGEIVGNIISHYSEVVKASE